MAVKEDIWPCVFLFGGFFLIMVGPLVYMLTKSYVHQRKCGKRSTGHTYRLHMKDWNPYHGVEETCTNCGKTREYKGNWTYLD
jgi:hypothetical protein